MGCWEEICLKILFWLFLILSDYVENCLNLCPSSARRETVFGRFAYHFGHCLRWSTRDSVLRGSQRLGTALAAAEQKPEAPLEGFAFQAKALSDLWATLDDKECHVVRDGKAFVGKALWVTWESHGAGSQIQPSKHVWSTSKLIQTWTTRVLCKQERSRRSKNLLYNVLLVHKARSNLMSMFVLQRHLVNLVVIRK